MEEQAVRNVGGRSLSQLARDAILESIVAERFEEGRIPAEQELVNMLGVSRTTVRAALQSLEQDGIIIRVRGRGTRVRAHTTPSTLGLQRLISFHTLLREAGHEPTVTAEWATTTTPTGPAVAQLGLGATERCYLIHRQFVADERPAIAITDTVPERLMQRGLRTGEAVPDSIFEFSERYLHHPIDHAIVDIVARTADEEIASLLSIPAGEPLIDLQETHYTAHDEPVAFSEIHVNQDFVRFRVLRRR